MNCKSVQAYLSAYLDGELNGTERLDIRQHLHECSECQAEEQQLKVLKQMLRGLPTYTPSEDFEERLVKNVVQVQEQKRTSRFSLGLDWRFVAGFAATAALATFAMLQVTGRPGPDTANATVNDTLASEIGRDQMFIAGNDPLSGNRFAVPTTYANR